MACRELGRWLPAIEAAEEGGITDGRYDGAALLSPSYMHSLIEAGKDRSAWPSIPDARSSWPTR